VILPKQFHDKFLYRSIEGYSGLLARSDGCTEATTIVPLFHSFIFLSRFVCCRQKYENPDIDPFENDFQLQNSPILMWTIEYVCRPSSLYRYSTRSLDSLSIDNHSVLGFSLLCTGYERRSLCCFQACKASASVYGSNRLASSGGSLISRWFSRRLLNGLDWIASRFLAHFFSVLLSLSRACYKNGKAIGTTIV
jgi:hypothetical protein